MNKISIKFYFHTASLERRQTNQHQLRALALSYKKGCLMPFIRIWLHCVWGTKNRIAYLNHTNKKIIIDHIRENVKQKGVYIDFINGGKDHIHCIISLNQDQTISKVMQLIKGESSFWINKDKMMKTRFEWADEYFAVSISESHLDEVREYIRNQEEHHRKKTWEEEYNEFITKYGFQKMRG